MVSSPIYYYNVSNYHSFCLALYLRKSAPNHLGKGLDPPKSSKFFPKRLPQTIRGSIETTPPPPPYGQCQNKRSDNLVGASLMLRGIIVQNSILGNETTFEFSNCLRSMIFKSIINGMKLPLYYGILTNCNNLLF